METIVRGPVPVLVSVTVCANDLSRCAADSLRVSAGYLSARAARHRAVFLRLVVNAASSSIFVVIIAFEKYTRKTFRRERCGFCAMARKHTCLLSGIALS